MRIGSSLLVGLSLLGLPAYGAGELAQTFTLDGRLYADAAGASPLTDSDVTVVIQILNQSQSCILYEETQSHFNASIGNGYFTFQVGSPVGATKRSSLDSGHTMAAVYSNTGGVISGRTFGGSACSDNPFPGDGRYVRMLVTPSSDGVTRTLSPNMALDSVPMATVAERAESLQGLSASQVLQVNTSGSEVLSQSNLENVFSSSNYSALTSLLSGSSSMYSKAASNGTSVLPNVSSPATPSAGQMWYDGGSIKYYDGSSTKTLGTAGSGITSLTIGTGLTPTGTISSSGSIAVDVGTTAGKIVQVASGDKLPAIDGSALTNLNGSAVNSGTIGGTTAVNTSGNITTTGTLSSGAITSSGNITTTGDVSANDISASGNANVTGNVVASGNGSFAAMSSGQISLFDSATTNTNYVTLKTPATGTLTSDYTLTLPPALPGAPGQVLTSDTSGVLSWSSPSTGSVTSVTSAGAPIVIGGSASAPTVGVNAATTAASGVVQLAASGGTTAGTVVQANDTRLSDSRAPSGGASGDLAGTYPNPTVAGIQGKAITYTTLTTGDHLKYDGSGWVNAALSAADLSDSSDLLKASNMPATCAADKTLTFSSPTGTWVCSSIAIDAAAITSGTIDAARLPAEAKYWESATGGINYAGGNVGIGTTTPSAKLQIQDASGNAFLTVTDSQSGVSSEAGLFLESDGASGGVSALSSNFNNPAGWADSLLLYSDNTNSGGLRLHANAGNITFSNGWSPKVDRMAITAAGNVGIGTTTPSEALEVSGNIKGTQLCIGTDCRSAWPGSGGGGTVTSVGSGTGLTGGPITGTGTLAVDVGTTAGKIVQVDTGDKLPVIDGSQLTNLNASNLASGTVAAARMPALTGDVTTSAGSVATTLAKIQGKTLTVTSPTSGDFLKYDGSGWVNAALSLSSSDLSDASTLIKSTQMPASCGADHALTFSSPTGTWSCTSIAIDATAITSGTIDAARLPAEAKYWQAATGGINYAGGNVGIGTTTPGAPLDIQAPDATLYAKLTNGNNWAGMNMFNEAGTLTGSFQIGGSTASVAHLRNNMFIGARQASGKLIFVQGTAANEIARFDENGQLGIGTTTPSEMLDVAGKVKGTELCIGSDCRSTWPTGGGGTVTSVTSGGAPIVIGGTAADPTVSVTASTTAAMGVVQLAADGGTTSGTVVQADDARLSDSRAPSGTAGGDLSGNYPSPIVAKLNGKSVTYGSITTGDFLKYNGTGWVNAAMSTANLSDASDLLKASNMPANCSASQTLTFSSPTGTWICSNIGLDTAALTSGTIADARLPASAKYWQAATGGINYAGGNVGIGTTSPAEKLDIAGAVKIGTAAGTDDGTIRWTGSDFEGRKGGAWVSLTGSSGAAAPPAFQVNRNGTDQTVSNNVYTKMSWSNEVFDTNNNFSGDKFTPTVAGKYALTTSIYCINATSYCMVGLYKNGTEVLTGFQRAAQSFATISAVVDMNGTTDYVEVYARAGGGTTISGTSTYTFFSGILASSTTVTSAGSGTTDYIPQWTGSTALGNSPIAVSSGNVGIGTATPEAGLSVVTGSSTFSTPAAAGVHINAGSGYSKIEMANSTGSLIDFTATGTDYNGRILYNNSANSMHMYTSGNTTAAMTIDSGGNVGIGTTTPAARLDVNGRIKSANTRTMASSTTSVSTTSTSYVDLPDLSLTVTTGNQPIMIHVNISGCYDSTASTYGWFTLLEDGVVIATTLQQYVSNADVKNAVIQWMKTPTAGSHTYKVQWKTSAGTLYCSWASTTRTLMIWE